ncbi:MAG: hypothetical protein LC107_04315 [Chitinophagales bacterium]|nr:hypothetical protein [Chitinophagales bacterium]
MKYKSQRLNQIKKQILNLGLHIVDEDYMRPWGGFFKIADADIHRFIQQFFPEMKDELSASKWPLSPKILCVQPHKQLSWQYHYRRAEIWKLVKGKAAYKISNHDEEGEVNILELGKVLVIGREERHRLIGLNEWGIIAEIWQHTDPDKPSDEEDIVRLQDDYGR